MRCDAYAYQGNNYVDSGGINKTMQTILIGHNSIARVEEILEKNNYRKLLLVCDSSYPYLPIRNTLDEISIPHISYSGFSSNPLYEDVCNGIGMFNREGCDSIVAVGGGSALDAAKCIKLFCRMDATRNFLEQPMIDTRIPLIAIPTTAGTGSESTQYAVIYFHGEKQSITHKSILPDYAILEPSVLKTLPLYQKKCTMLDALCQGIESWWSVNSTEESKEYSKRAIELIIQNWREYIEKNTDSAAERIMLAANYAGRAINITQTTAAHAMSYKLTSIYQLPHGHAVALCLPRVWDYMNTHINRCIDARGSKYLANVFRDISTQMGCESVEGAIEFFDRLMVELDINAPKLHSVSDIDVLTLSVNQLRLRNNPVEMDTEALRSIYQSIMEDRQ